MLKFIHSYFAYLVITLLVVSTIRFLVRYVLSKDYTPTDFRLALITFIVSHTQLLIGLFLYFISDKFSLWYELSLNEIITSPINRLYLIEHPIVNIIAIVFITRGYSLHKKRRVSNSKFKAIGFNYLLGLVLLLSRIPWDNWI
jgi:cytochrome c oxidase subunit IV